MCVRVSPEDSQDAEDAETSGVRVLIKSPNAVEAKDKEVWITAEEVVAMLLAGIKVGFGSPGVPRNWMGVA